MRLESRSSTIKVAVCPSVPRWLVKCLLFALPVCVLTSRSVSASPQSSRSAVRLELSRARSAIVGSDFGAAAFAIRAAIRVTATDRCGELVAALPRPGSGWAMLSESCSLSESDASVESLATHVFSTAREYEGLSGERVRVTWVRDPPGEAVGRMLDVASIDGLDVSVGVVRGVLRVDRSGSRIDAVLGDPSSGAGSRLSIVGTSGVSPSVLRGMVTRATTNQLLLAEGGRALVEAEKSGYIGDSATLGAAIDEAETLIASPRMHLLIDALRLAYFAVLREWTKWVGGAIADPSSGPLVLDAGWDGSGLDGYPTLWHLLDAGADRNPIRSEVGPEVTCDPLSTRNRTDGGGAENWIVIGSHRVRAMVCRHGCELMLPIGDGHFSIRLAGVASRSDELLVAMARLDTREIMGRYFGRLRGDPPTHRSDAVPGGRAR